MDKAWSSLTNPILLRKTLQFDTGTKSVCVTENCWLMGWLVVFFKLQLDCRQCKTKVHLFNLRFFH
jgi:hypothetical protein